ncbi:1,4-alpha-glucan branching enzyme GlgB [Streptomyces griseorubiginosus]
MALRDTSLPEPSGPARCLPAPPLDGTDRSRLLAGAHHDPHALLGAHPVAGGIVFRALRPFARAVSVVIDGMRSGLASEGDGLFSALLPLDAIPDYTLLVAYADGEQEVHDPYRFLPALGETDLHLIREGRHEQLWKALGAEPITHQGVTGTRFAVWAPNAQGSGSPGSSPTGTDRRSRCARSARPGYGSCSCRGSARAPGTSSRSPPGTATGS